MDFVENVGRRSKVAGDNGDFINVGVFSVNGYERNVLFQNLGGVRFIDMAYPAGCDRIEDGRGLGALDVDSDGDLDLIVNNYLQPAHLLINHAPLENHWLRFKLVGTKSNRSAVGTRVVVFHGAEKETREVTTTAAYLSGQSLYLHFGLGLDRVADRVVIHWPSKKIDELRDLPADCFYQVVEGEGKAAPVGRVEKRSEPAAATASGSAHLNSKSAAPFSSQR